MELEDRSMAELEADAKGERTQAERLARRQYFQELFRLQGELVKLQDWVVPSRQKIVILFEGRDAAQPRAALSILRRGVLTNV